MEDKSKTFGQFVQKKRNEKGLTQKELALQIGYALDTIRAIEQDRKSYTPSVQIISVLAKALDVSEGELKDYLKPTESLKENTAETLETPPVKKRALSISVTLTIVITSILFVAIGVWSVNKILPTATAISIITPLPLAINNSWTAQNYICGGKNFTEQIRIELGAINYLVATKIDGDPCIGAGEKTWEGVYNNNGTFPAKFVVKLWIKNIDGKMSTVDSEAVMVNPNRIEVKEGSNVIVFTNDGDEVVLNSPSVSPAWTTNEPQCNGSWNGWYRIERSEAPFAYLAANVQSAEQSKNSANWTTKLPKSGHWKVEFYNFTHSYYEWPCLERAFSEDTSNAVYKIKHSNGETQVHSDQQNTSNWVGLGTYSFLAGLDASVSLDTMTGEALNSKYVLFSPIRFVYVGP